MSDRIFTTEEKLAEVEQLVENFRWSRRYPEDPEYQTYLVLKAIAEDLRAPLPATQNKALEVVGFVVNAAMRSKAQLGYLEVGHQQAIADRVMKYWGTIRSALEQCGGKEKVSAGEYQR
jgi:hypothetical protein